MTSHVFSRPDFEVLRWGEVGRWEVKIEKVSPEGSKEAGKLKPKNERKKEYEK
ncbi:MAG: hypothetical protein DVB28_000444 [Verrucomicrobia bacterium]|nr:MAG: hypothetical protein DVB28_000444 [Verrucomicrobiota bacterium]